MKPESTSDRFTLACVWVRGTERRRQYGANYVLKLFEGVARNTWRSFDFVCLTNVPDEVPSVARPVQIPYPRDARGRRARGWWAKVQLFNPKLEIATPGERVLYMDLDAIPLDSLDAIISYDSAFAIAPDMAPAFMGKGNRPTVKRYNSSVMVWNYGFGASIYYDYDTTKPMTLWGDQDWIAVRKPTLDILPKEWFCRLSPDGPNWGTNCRVLLCNKWKPHEAREKWPWFANLW